VTSRMVPTAAAAMPTPKLWQRLVLPARDYSSARRESHRH
jgi:hypothetical protein